MGLGNDPGDATLSGTLTKPSVHGVASFSNLTLNQRGLGYTLIASSAAVSSATSSSFDVGQTTTADCSTAPCQTSLSSPDGVSTLAVSANQGAGTLSESIDSGSPLVCDEAHGGYTGFDPNWYGFSITGSSDKELTYTILNVDPNNFFTLCFGATADFLTDTGAEAAPGTLPDGNPDGFIGPLPSCNGNPAFEAVNPCVESVVPNPNGSGVVLTAHIPEAFQGDPWSHM
jgi:hypothetical protein